MTATATRQHTSADTIRDQVARLPRYHFAFTPTPLEECPKMTSALAGPRVLVKRDDLTGFAFGGNKVRALDFTMGDVLAKGCDAFIVTNKGQSNHARIHSSACVRMGVHPVIVKTFLPDEEVTGNLLLDRIIGAEIVESHGRPTDEVLDEVLARLRSEGKKPYASTREESFQVVRVVAYVEMALELAAQLRAAGVGDDQQVHLFIVAGRSSTGLVLAAKLLGLSWRIHQVSVDTTAERIAAATVKYARAAAELLELPDVVSAGDFDVHDQYVGGYYGATPPTTLEAIKLAARTDVIFMDPTYTGKAFSGLIGEVRAGRVPKSDVAVFIHTGGLPIIFAAHEVLKNL